jgi:hypothetical protein
MRHEATMKNAGTPTHGVASHHSQRNTFIHVLSFLRMIFMWVSMIGQEVPTAP